jgi:hypothetical protein
MQSWSESNRTHSSRKREDAANEALTEVPELCDDCGESGRLEDYENWQINFARLCGECIQTRELEQ